MFHCIYVPHLLYLLPSFKWGHIWFIQHRFHHLLFCLNPSPFIGFSGCPFPSKPPGMGLQRVGHDWETAQQLTPGGSVVKNPPAKAGDTGDVGSIPGWGRSPGGGSGNPPQYSCLENPIDREDLWATVRGVAKNWALVNN